MAKRLLIFISALMFMACNNTPKMGNNPEPDFDSFTNRFIEAFWHHHPDWATWVGNHDFDTMLIIPDDNSRNLQNEFAENYLDSLKQFDYSELTNSQKTDYHLSKTN